MLLLRGHDKLPNPHTILFRGPYHVLPDEVDIVPSVRHRELGVLVVVAARVIRLIPSYEFGYGAHPVISIGPDLPLSGMSAPPVVNILAIRAKCFPYKCCKAKANKSLEKEHTVPHRMTKS